MHRNSNGHLNLKCVRFQFDFTDFFYIHNSSFFISMNFRSFWNSEPFFVNLCLWADYMEFIFTIQWRSCCCLHIATTFSVQMITFLELHFNISSDSEFRFSFFHIIISDYLKDDAEKCGNQIVIAVGKKIGNCSKNVSKCQSQSKLMRLKCGKFHAKAPHCQSVD